VPVPRRILVRRPSPRLADGELSYLQRVPIDTDRALEEWEGYVEAFRSRGWAITEIEPADEHPDGVFVEDTVVIFDDLAVLASPGADSRRGEMVSTARAAAALVADGTLAGVAELAAGRLDGGDVLKVGRTAYVGLGRRTDRAGLDSLRSLVEPRGWAVVPVSVSSVLHLKSAVTALPDGTVVGFLPLADALATYPRFLPVPEQHGSAVVDLGEDVILMSEDAPATADLFRSRGLEVVTVPVGEFEKLEGCVTCLSVRIRD
jgi:dimethylargininase